MSSVQSIRRCNPNPSVVLAKSSLTSEGSGFNTTGSHHFRKTEDLVWCSCLFQTHQCLQPHLCYSHMSSLVLISYLCSSSPTYWGLHLGYCILVSNERRLLLSLCLMWCLMCFFRSHSQTQARNVSPRQSGT